MRIENQNTPNSQFSIFNSLDLIRTLAIRAAAVLPGSDIRDILYVGETDVRLRALKGLAGIKQDASPRDIARGVELRRRISGLG